MHLCAIWIRLEQQLFPDHCMASRTGAGGRTKDRVPSFVWRKPKSFYCFSPWEKAGLCFQYILRSILHKKTTNELLISILYYVPVLSSYVRDHAALLKTSATADFSTPLKCLASGKKSIEQLCPSAPRQTSALELLVVYCFHVLLVYPSALCMEC